MGPTVLWQSRESPMEESWAPYGSPVGLEWEYQSPFLGAPWDSHGSTIVPWESCMTLPQCFRGTQVLPMLLLLHSHGISMRLPLDLSWDRRASVVFPKDFSDALPWDYRFLAWGSRGTSMGVSRESHGTCMGLPYGAFMGF